MEAYPDLSKPPSYQAPPQAVTNQPLQMVSPAQTIIQINTQVISNPLLPRGVPRPWSTDMMACCDDMPICLCTTFVPCYPCVMAVDMNESCAVPICVPGALVAMRAIIRGRHNIEGNLCNDCVVLSFCGVCTQCQLAREVQNIKCGKAQP